MTMNETILIVEDETDIAKIVDTYLQAAKFNTEVFHTGTGVVEWVKQNSPSVILLDLMLPGKDGLSICREVRQFSDAPIIMTTAKVEEVDRLIGLDCGADDYLCKPYSTRELVARVKATVRRLNNQVTSQQSWLKVDEGHLSIGYGDKTVELTTVEFRLFYLLYQNSNRIYSRAQILDLVYSDYRDVSDRTVDSHIRNLRKKLTGLGLEHDLIRSIYGSGYKFEPLP